MIKLRNGNSIPLLVAREICKYWLRRHRTLAGLAAVATVLTVAATLARLNAGENLLLGVAAFTPFIAGMLATSGIVADERESGLMMMWLQKPGSLVWMYGVRYALSQLLLVAFALSLAAVLGAVGVAAGFFTPSMGLRLAFFMVIVATLPAAMVFACSAWGVRRDSTVAFAVILIGVTAGGALALDYSLAARIIKSVVFPVDAITEAAQGRTSVIAHPIGLIAAHLAAWSIIGWLGLYHIDRRYRG